MADILEKVFKTIVLKALKEQRKMQRKKKKMRHEQNENISKEIDNLKRNQKEILELQSTMAKIKN